MAIFLQGLGTWAWQGGVTGGGVQGLRWGLLGETLSCWRVVDPSQPLPLVTACPKPYTLTPTAPIDTPPPHTKVPWHWQGLG